MENLNELLKMVVPMEWLFSVMPFEASTHAGDIDFLYWFLIISCAILFLLLVVPMIWFVIKYRRKTPQQRATSQADHNFWLESLWTFVPFIYLAVLFVWGFWQYMDMYVAPHDAKELRVTGQKWQWSVDYPEEEINVAGVGVTVAVPVDTPIKLIMSSQDVIHSFFVPNLRVKQDVVPGRYSTLWFTANRVGEYPVLCAEYCGDLHSQMLAKLIVMPRDAYQTWLDNQKGQDEELPLSELGKKLYNKLGCASCHTLDGTIKIGPSFKNLYGKMETMSDGSQHKIDDTYIKTKIFDPTFHVAKGFPPVMPPFKRYDEKLAPTGLKERDVLGLIEFIKAQAN